MTTVATLEDHHPDPLCAAAAEQVIGLLIDIHGPEAVGAHVRADGLGPLLVDHRVICLLPGYPDWQWSVVVTRVPHSHTVTVCEIDLLPGPDAVVAPSWVPWNDRLRPGDLAPGQVAPTAPDEPALAPGWSAEEESFTELEAPQQTPLHWEPGLNRPRVLSRYGQERAANRWYQGSAGPNNRETRQAPGSCSDCGWLLTIGGRLGQEFGVCTNELAPRDGTVVSYSHGCGGYSEAAPPVLAQEVPTILDDQLPEWTDEPLDSP